MVKLSIGRESDVVPQTQQIVEQAREELQEISMR